MKVSKCDYFKSIESVKVLRICLLMLTAEFLSLPNNQSFAAVGSVDASLNSKQATTNQFAMRTWCNRFTQVKRNMQGIFSY